MKAREVSQHRVLSVRHSQTLTCTQCTRGSWWDESTGCGVMEDFNSYTSHVPVTIMLLLWPPYFKTLIVRMYYAKTSSALLKNNNLVFLFHELSSAQFILFLHLGPLRFILKKIPATLFLNHKSDVMTLNSWSDQVTIHQIKPWNLSSAAWAIHLCSGAAKMIQGNQTADSSRPFPFTRHC